MRTARRVLVGTAVMSAVMPAVLAGCTALPFLPTPSSPSPPSSPSAPAPQPGGTSQAAPPTTAAPTGPPSAADPSAAPPVAGTPVVVLDPGHNGGNATHLSTVTRRVPDGRGGMKACNSTGTATNAGYAEHAFTFDVARRVAKRLEAAGVRVVLTRKDDRGVGPCVDVRGRAGQVADADAVVSIHADGSAAANHGFHVAYSAPPLNAAQTGPARALATDVRDAMRAGGFPDSDYIGNAGLSPRRDLAGLNLATRPTVLVECANMRNAAEAATVSTQAGRERYAAAISAGILTFVAR